MGEGGRSVAVGEIVKAGSGVGVSGGNAGDSVVGMLVGAGAAQAAMNMVAARARKSSARQVGWVDFIRTFDVEKCMWRKYNPARVVEQGCHFAENKSLLQAGACGMVGTAQGFAGEDR